MSNPHNIRILEKDNNRRGDLFGRLMADLFVALGYSYPRLNVHKSGRELDLSADHRLEPRRAIAECKATSEPIGGDDLNKFVGSLDVEHEDKRPVAGYFISLGGFRETAIEQEKQRRTKVITLTAPQVVNELVQGRLLIAKDRATELAGRYCADCHDLILDPESELLAHSRGWIWAVYYTQGKARTHFALIHSDGTPLARALANEIITADHDCGGNLDQLVCLNPLPPPGTDSDPRVVEALAAYGQYLANECGYIQLDGLPADSDVGSRRLRLENLFVPLHLDVTTGREEMKKERQPIGAVLTDHPRLALLAAPGGGKSTLIKRLAVAYSDSARRGEIADNLPQRNWLPLFFRCRELRHLARGSFAELTEALSQREPVRQHSATFRAYVDRAIAAGRVLLLVDGLDEISDSGDRAAFVCTLRTALLAYPNVGIVITSREAGFRHVAAHLAPICTHATMSSFDEDDIRRLSVSWHREVVGDTEKVRSDAEHLAATIAGNDRIQRLAVNPLLLTTLLLVKRWVGSLPTRRAILYDKAVEVLLMTWNTEGHTPIPEGEALPQLCYVASAMLLEGIQKVSRPRLAKLLQEAREALPTELGYVELSVEEFIHRVEDRSSLLMMTGLDVEDGRLVEFFEFRHLTFQEFLTARAMVEGWHPGRSETDTLVSVIEPHFDKESWREVIPLAGVLGGKASELLIQRLTEKIQARTKESLGTETPALIALINCLADEAAARPETIRRAIREVVRFGTAISHALSAPMLARGKYGADLREEAGKLFLLATPAMGGAGDALMTAVWWQTVEQENPNAYLSAATQFIEMSQAEKEIVRCEGILSIGRLSFNVSKDDHAKTTRLAELIQSACPTLVKAMFEGSISEKCSALYAMDGVGNCRLWALPGNLRVIAHLYNLWREAPHETIRKLALRALTAQPIVARESQELVSAIDVDEIKELTRTFGNQNEWLVRPAVLILAWYTCAISNVDIAKLAWALSDGSRDSDDRTKRLQRELLEQIAKESPDAV